MLYNILQYNSAMIEILAILLLDKIPPTFRTFLNIPQHLTINDNERFRQTDERRHSRHRVWYIITYNDSIYDPTIIIRLKVIWDIKILCPSRGRKFE